MPSYHYVCNDCQERITVQMQISEYLSYKQEIHHCNKCQGVLTQKVFPTYAKIDRDKEYIIQSAKEEAKQIVERMNRGDEKTITEMCGDKARNE